MEGDAELFLALTDRPRDGNRPAVMRQQRRVAVDPAESRHRERIGGDLPWKAHAHDEIRLHRRKQRRDRRAARRHEDVELARQLVEHPAEVEAAVAAVGVANRQQGDGLVPRVAQRSMEPERDRQDPRHDHDAPSGHDSLKMRPPEAWLRALTTISSTFMCHGRVSAQSTQSAMSSRDERIDALVDGRRLLGIALEADDRELRLDEPGVDRREADRAPEQVLAQGIREAAHGELRRDVGGGVLVRLPPGDGAHVEDVAAGADVRQAKPRHAHEPADVRLEHRRLVLLGRLVERVAAEGEPGVVEEDVEAPELLDARR